MKAWYRKHDIWQETDSLLEALDLQDLPKGSIAVVGAGGKTSAIFRMAKEAADQNSRVIITTTTHMFQEPGALAATAAEARELLLRQLVVIAGRPVENGKIIGPADEEMAGMGKLADLILIEADGSKRLPLKVPSDREPVIPSGTDRVFVVAGLSGIGHSISECCHRQELVQSLLQTSMEHIIEPKDVATMISKGYLTGEFRKKKNPVTVILNQADDEAARAAAEEIADYLKPYTCIITKLKEE